MFLKQAHFVNQTPFKSVSREADPLCVEMLLVGSGKSKKTIGGHGQKDKRSKNIQMNTSESGIKCVCLNARSIINKKTELNIMVE